MNKLWFGDNLNIMRHRLEDETIDLIYLDPPYNSYQAPEVVTPLDSGLGF